MKKEVSLSFDPGGAGDYSLKIGLYFDVRPIFRRFEGDLFQDGTKSILYAFVSYGQFKWLSAQKTLKSNMSQWLTTNNSIEEELIVI